jgi:hypothetical protein
MLTKAASERIQTASELRVEIEALRERVKIPLSVPVAER